MLDFLQVLKYAAFSRDELCCPWFIACCVRLSTLYYRTVAEASLFVFNTRFTSMIQSGLMSSEMEIMAMVIW